MWPAVFYIETPSGNGTGWLITPNQILTNQHVVAGFNSVTVRQAQDASFSATVIATDSIRDIALLEFNPSTASLPLRAEPLTFGTVATNDAGRPVMALGYSGFGVKSDGTVGSVAANIGVVSQIFETSQGWQLAMDAPIDPGDSGGPVLDEEGLVIGMNVSVQEETSSGQRVVGTFFAVHIDEIRDALPRLRAERSR